MKFLISSALLLSSAVSYNLPLINDFFYAGSLDFIHFQYDYSYDQYPPVAYVVNSNYFAISPAPDGILDALHIQLYPTDKSYLITSATCPRSEMSAQHTSKNYIKDNVPWVVEFYSWIDHYQQGYNFCFTQIYSQVIGPNILLCWKEGAYVIEAIPNGVYTTQIMAGFGSSYGAPMVSPDLSEDMNRWVSWRMEINLGSSGVVTVYRDGVQFGQLKGNFPGGVSYLRMGIYTQPNKATPGLCSPEYMSLWFKNLIYVQADPTYPAALVLSTATNATVPTINPLSFLGQGNKHATSDGEQTIPMFFMVLLGLIGIAAIQRI